MCSLLLAAAGYCRRGHVERFAPWQLSCTAHMICCCFIKDRLLHIASPHLSCRLAVRPGPCLCNMSSTVLSSLQHCNVPQKHAAGGRRATLQVIYNSVCRRLRADQAALAVNVPRLNNLLEGMAAPCRGVGRWDCSLQCAAPQEVAGCGPGQPGCQGAAPGGAAGCQGGSAGRGR